MRYLVYGLYSSDDLGHCRYVGYTTKSLTHRLRQHLNKIKNNTEPNKYKSNWIDKCIKCGYDIVINKLAEYQTAEDMYAGEQYYIQHMKSIGTKLTNMTDGGERAGSPSDEVKNKIRLKALGHKRNVGRKHPASHGEKVRLAKLGKSRPDLTNRQLGENNKQAKLTKRDVLAIKELIHTMSPKEIAAKYNVSFATVYDIKMGRT